MRLRCDLTLDGEERKLVIVAGPSDSHDHLALRLAGYLLLWKHEPLLDASTKLPALANYEFLPDVLALDPGGDIKVWLECGSATLHSLGKLVSRVPEGRGRIIVLKTQPRDAERLREECDRVLGDKSRRVEILSWPRDEFKKWSAAVTEKCEVFGESSEASLNVVLGETPFAIDLERH